MKPIYKMLVSGMLATATAYPALQARPLVSTVGVLSQQQVTTRLGVQVTDALAYKILARVVGQFEAQLQQSLSTDFLFQEYKAGRIAISFIGNDGIGNFFRVAYVDILGIAMVEDE
jgi:hypothetical protein